MRLLLLSEASIQPRTSSREFSLFELSHFILCTFFIYCFNPLLTAWLLEGVRLGRLADRHALGHRVGRQDAATEGVAKRERGWVAQRRRSAANEPQAVRLVSIITLRNRRIVQLPTHHETDLGEL